MAGAVQINPVEISGTGHRVETEIRIKDRMYRIHFQTDDNQLSAQLEAFLAIALLPAMKLRQPIQTSGSPNSQFLSGVEQIQDLIKSWKPGYGRVEIRGVDPKENHAFGGERVGLFFSGGLDSFYTFMRHKDEITDLVHIQGFDIPLEERALLQQVSAMVRGVAAHFGKRAVIIETNARKFLDAYVFWGFTHGSLMASVGYMLSKHFKQFYISASHSIERLRPWGSDPRLDPLWGVDGLEFVHDGSESDRFQKLMHISQQDIALRSLCVCLHHPGGAYNCGACEKCRRVKTFLRALDLEDRGPLFDKPFELEDIYRLDMRHWHSLQRCLEFLESSGKDPELEGALRNMLHQPAWQKEVKGAAHDLRLKLTKRMRRSHR